MRKLPIWLGTAVLAGTALGQSSSSFTLQEQSFNAGGHPAGGVVLQSASFTISLDAIGDAVVANSLSSASFAMEGGFIGAYPPPGEVSSLTLTSKVTLEWAPEESAGVYNLYRDLQSNLLGLGFGNCEQQGLPSATTTDNDPVPAGDGYFYLVTVENRLDEEGTKGFQSDATERPNAAPCP